LTAIQRLSNFGMSAIVPVLTLAVWEIVARYEMVSTFLLPSFSEVVERIGTDLTTGVILDSTLATLWLLVVSYGLAVIIGVTLGILMSRVGFIRWLMDPIISIGFPAPKISLLPIFVLWFGVFDQPKIVIAVFSCVFPIIAGTWAGTQGVDKYLLWSAENLGTRQRALLWQVILPAALPQVFTALQVALPIAFIVVIVAEMLTGGNGLGGSMMEATRLADPAGVFSNLIVISILGFAAMKALQWLRRRILIWHEEVQRQGNLL
jgi:ABC-type nitrate/sulfonate/bicarbonate transport system permease component